MRYNRFALVFLLACQPDVPKEQEEGKLCPRETTAVGPGDANGDGAVDLADVLVILRHVADGGPAPVCTAGVDLIPDEKIELDDAFSLLLYLYEGSFSLPEADCSGSPSLPAPGCVQAEARLVEEEGAVWLQLRSGAPIEAWSVSLQGCTITSATTDGTAAASVALGGLRDLGYDATFLTTAGVVSAVLLDDLEPVALPTDAWSPVLRLQVQDCCTLKLGTLQGPGQAVESLLVIDGAAYPLPPLQAKVGCGA
jgi:hypothetical protein